MTPFIELLASNVVVSGILALVVLLITRLWQNPHLGRALWLLVLIKLVTPPLIEISVPLLTGIQSSSTTPSSTAANPLESDALSGSLEPIVGANTAQESVPLSTAPVSRWPIHLLTIWALGLLPLLLLAYRRHRQLSGILRRSRAADVAIQEEAARLASKLGISNCPEIRISNERVGPFVTVRLSEQAIVLPTSLLEAMSAEERQTVLAHELAHVRRGDRWIRFFELAVLSLYWWNPIAWLASCRLRQSMEECCDAVVIWAMPESRKCYGQALLRTVEFLTEPESVRPLAANAFGSSRFKHRIENIMKRKTNHRMTGPVWGLSILLGIAVLPFATTGVSQEPDKPRGETQPAEEQAESSTPAAKSATETKPAHWQICQFVIVDGDTEAVQRKIAELSPKSSSSTIEEITELFSKNGFPMYNMSSQSGSSMSGIPSEMKAAAEALEFGKTSRVLKTGDRHFCMVRKIVDQKKYAAAKRAKREYEAQLRLLILDVKSAEIRSDAAREKVVHSPKGVSASAREAKFDAQLAEIAVERAKLAIELFKAKNEPS